MTTPSYGSSLSPNHQRLLSASAISPDVAAERGFVSVDQKIRLERLGFNPAQRRTPGLLIPIHTVDGDGPVRFQYRPDIPRLDDAGKVIKYESLPKSKAVLDVHPRNQVEMGDVTATLWVTEGARKVDALVSDGRVAVGLAGVDMWAVKDQDGFRTPLAGWKKIALQDREVIIIFDSDLNAKDEVRRALKDLARFLYSRGAIVKVALLPDGPNGEKTGVDDYLGLGGLLENVPVVDATDYVVPAPPPVPIMPVGNFPIHVLPDVCLRFVDRCAVDISPGVTDFAAAGIFPVAATALGRDWKVVTATGWEERGGAIWLALVGGPGVKKTPVLRRLLTPIEAINTRHTDVSRRDLKVWQREKDPNAKGDRPPWLQIKVGDITMERLAQAMEQNPQKLIMVADELKGWVGRFNQYRGGAGDDRQKWLSFWAGANELIQRKGDPLPIELIDPTISVIGGVQPAVLNSFFRGNDDGLIPRVLFTLGEFQECPDCDPFAGDTPDPAYADYGTFIDTLWHLAPRTLTFAPEARVAAKGMYDELERRAGRNVDGLGEVAAKMEAYLLRFAGIFNGFDAVAGFRGPISAEQMDSAWELVGYFTQTAKLVRDFDDGSSDRDDEFARKVEATRRWLLKNPGASRSKILQYGPSSVRRAEVLGAVLKSLGVEL